MPDQIPQDIDWPSTLRSSCQLGDADYAAAIEWTAGQPMLLLDPEEGILPLLRRILERLRKSAARL